MERQISYRLKNTSITFALTTLVLALLLSPLTSPAGGASAAGFCTAPFVPVSLPLNDMGSLEYVRLNSGPTGYIGGLYPNGSNERPPAHEAAGLSQAGQVKPLNTSGTYDPNNGTIVMISVGMSNTSTEFKKFIEVADPNPYVNPKLVIVNGAQGGQVSNDWADPNGAPWDKLNLILSDEGLSPQQVQVAWVKLAQFGAGDFPSKAQSLQSDLEATAQNLANKFPNLKLAFFSSRTRSYIVGGEALSPEPTAFETGFSVKWLIEKQINGDLNFNPAAGPVKAPYLSWGPYLWIDGLNERSDGLVWTQQDLNEDCTHPSDQGALKVASQLMNFFSYDSIGAPWFLADPSNPPPPFPIEFSDQIFIPLLSFNFNSTGSPRP